MTTTEKTYAITDADLDRAATLFSRGIMWSNKPDGHFAAIREALSKAGDVLEDLGDSDNALHIVNRFWLTISQLSDDALANEYYRQLTAAGK